MNTERNMALSEFAPGMILQGTYRIVGPIAEGGCGEIFLADHTRLPGQVAIKVLHRGLQQNAEVLSRFRQEAEITATLRHPHIVQVLDFNVTDQGYPYLVMEMLEGQSLSSGSTTPGSSPRPPRSESSNRSRRRCTPRTSAGSSTAISSRTTSCSCPVTG